MSNKRLFFALWPSDRQRNQLRDIISPVAKLVEGISVHRGSWHVTLAYIGEFPEDRIPELQLATSTIAVEPFRLHFNRVEFWPRTKVAVLAAVTVPPEMERLIASLNSVLADFDVRPEDRTYRPHITVVKRARTFETQRLAQAGVTEWSDFDLIESISQPGSVNYRPRKQ